jgi:hypothetical protein
LKRGRIIEITHRHATPIFDFFFKCLFFIQKPFNIGSF